MKLRLFVLIFSTIFLVACARESIVEISYLAINGKDTAKLKLNIVESKFFGVYKINYPGGIMDSGYVRGEVKGDTLIGTFRYKPHGMAHFKQKPIALLRGNGEELVQGKGHVAIYLNIPYFWEEIPIKYNDPEFIFKPVH